MKVWLAVELPEHVVKRILRLIRAGRYPSISAFVEEALRLYVETRTSNKYPRTSRLGFGTVDAASKSKAGSPGGEEQS
jgi:Arc/MetJ-type ribon-helix-helix transcriptional regulator